jgi:magnesium transporter
MEAEDAADVRELLAYGEDTAGGLMNPDFVALPPDISADEAIRRLRVEARTKESIYYLFITLGDGTLAGVLSLRELLIAEPEARLRDVMTDHPITVRPDDPLELLAEQAAKYNLLTIPVLDERRRLLGMVTIDDVLDRVMAKA